MVIELLVDGEVKCAAADEQADLVLFNLVRDNRDRSTIIRMTGKLKGAYAKDTHPSWYRDDLFTGTEVIIRFSSDARATAPFIVERTAPSLSALASAVSPEVECSFCGKRALGVDRMAVGISGAICRDCVKVCADAMMGHH